jgi:hypothetical protein
MVGCGCISRLLLGGNSLTKQEFEGEKKPTIVFSWRTHLESWKTTQASAKLAQCCIGYFSITYICREVFDAGGHK